MAPADRRSRKKDRKRVKREKEKRRARAHAQEASGRAGRMQRTARWPLRECRISRDFRRTGLAQVIVARDGDEGVAFALFLVDLRCLGVKGCVAHVSDGEEGYERLLALASESDVLDTCAPELAAKVVLAGERAARELGLRPTADLELGRPLLAGIDAEACAEELEHRTADGKPVYVPGGDDDVPRVLRRLEEAVGRDGFYFVLPALGIGDEPEVFAEATAGWRKRLEDADLDRPDRPDRPDLRALARVRIAEARLVRKLARYGALRFGLDLFEEARAAYLDGAEPPEEDLEELYLLMLELPWALFTFRPGPHLAPDAAGEEDTVASLFLAERGDALDELERELAIELARRPLAVFAVTAVEPARSLALRDLLTGREVTVVEPDVSREARVGWVVYGRVADAGGISYLAGFDPALLPPMAQLDAIDLRDVLAGEGEHLDEEEVARVDVPLRATWHAWQGRGAEDAEADDDIEDGFRVPTYEYDVDCEIEEAFDALADLNGLADRERMLANAERDEDGRLLAAGIACTPADAPDDAELGEDDAIGAILLRRGKLFVIAPTRAVLAEIDAGIIARLGDRARPSSEEPASSPPPVIGARRRTAEEETRLWLDRPNADLRDLTPREAAGTPAGRERLWALLCDLEREDPYTDEEIDVARVRSELKLELHPR